MKEPSQDQVKESEPERKELQEWRMASFNANGLYDQGQVFQLLAKEGVQVIAVQETHQRTKRLPFLEDYWIATAKDDSEPKRGVAIYIRRSAAKLLVRDRKKGSELWVIVNGWPFSVSKPGLIGCVHVRPGDNAAIKRIGRFMARRNKDFSVCLLADLNLRPPPSFVAKEVWLGNGTSQLGVLLEQGVLHMGRYVGQQESHTWRGKVSMLDYVLGPASWASALISTQVRIDIPCRDHFVVEAKWDLGTGVVKEGHDIQSRVSVSGQEAVVTIFLKEGRISELSSISQLMCVIKDRLTERAEVEHRLKRRNYRKDTPEMRILRRQVTEAWKQYQMDCLEDSWQDWKELCRQWRRVCADQINVLWREFLEKMHYAQILDMGWYFAQSRRLMGKIRSKKTEFRLMDDWDQVMDPGVTLDAFRGHFSRIVSPRGYHDAHYTNRLRRIGEDWIANRPVYDGWNSVLLPVEWPEIQVATMKLKGRTSAGPDGIDLTVWRLLVKDEGFGLWLARMFSGILKSGEIPEEWLQARLAVIPKVENPTRVKEFRGIAVTQTS